MPASRKRLCWELWTLAQRLPTSETCNNVADTTVRHMHTEATAHTNGTVILFLRCAMLSIRSVLCRLHTLQTTIQAENS